MMNSILWTIAGGAVNPGDFSPLSLFIALASAGVILIIGSMIHKRFGS